MTFDNKTFCHRKLVLGVASGLLLGFSGSLAANDQGLTLNLESEKVAQALTKLGENAGVQIMVDHDVSDDVKLSAVQGTFTLEEALKTMLKGTNLVYQFVAEDVVVIRINNESEEEGGQSADEIDEEVVVLGQRVVTRNRINKVEPVLVYDTAYFQRFEPLTLNDMLKRVPGVFFDQLFNAPAFTTQTNFSDTGGRMPRLRNLTSQYSQILINGRRVAGIDFGFGGDDFLTTLPAEAVKEIRVIRSPSAELDSSGIGMTLDIVLKDGDRYSENTWRTGLSSLDGELNGVGSVNLRGSSEAFNYSLGVTIQNRAGFSENRDVAIGEREFIFPPFFDTVTSTESDSFTQSSEIEKDRNVIGTIGFSVGDNGQLDIEGKYVDTGRTGNVRSNGTRTSIERGTEFGAPVDETPQVEDTFDGTDVSRNTTNYGLAATYTLDLADLRWESTLSYDETDLETLNISRERDDDGTVFEDVRNEATGKGKRYQFNNHVSYQFMDVHELRFGVELLRTEDVNNNVQTNTNNFPFPPGAQTIFAEDQQEIDRTDTFLVYEWDIMEDLSFQIGARYEQADYESSAPPRLLMSDLEGLFEFDPSLISADVATAFSTEVSGFNPSAHLRWNIAENHDLRVSVARTVRRPNLGELDPEISVFVGLGSFDSAEIQIGNPLLENEESLGIDIGYDWRFENGVVGVNFFRREVDNLIEGVILPIEEISTLRPDIASEILRLRDVVALNSFPPKVLELQVPLNSSVELIAQGAELDVSLPVSFISESAQFYMNATYSSQTREGDMPNRSAAVNFSYDHELVDLGFTYGVSVNWITKDQRSSSFPGFSSTFTRKLDPNVEVFVEKSLPGNMLVRLTVENLLDAEDELDRQFTTSSSFGDSTTDQIRITESDPRILLTLRGVL